MTTPIGRRVHPSFALPHLKRDGAKVPFRDRLRAAILKPVAPDATPATPLSSVEELAAAVRSTDDKERLIGLSMAPLAAAIGILVMSALIANDPPARLKNGQPNRLHVSVALYHELTVVLLVMSVLILAMSLSRKRLFLGILLALYGLAIFNLHYWGFGIPFLMAGSWLLVRTYRLQQELRDAPASGASRMGSRRGIDDARATRKRPRTVGSKQGGANRPSGHPRRNPRGAS
ncbi:MAG TPA: hypothetical protein VNG13_01525 [Mycobacteriales bacterium]|nr:hypothetical protein [Mycobacteriales bacterium]